MVEQSNADKFRQPNNDIESAEDAKLLWEGGFSGKSMFGSWILAAVITLVVLIAIAAIPQTRSNATIWSVAFGLIAIMWVYLICIMFYRKWSKHYEISTQQLKHRDGILFRKLDRIELIDIDDVNYTQGPIQAMLDVGNIRIKSSDTSHPELVMYGIAEIKKVAEVIDNARRNERRKRGLHIEAI